MSRGSVVTMPRLLTDEEITRQLRDLPSWRRTGTTLTATYDAASFAAAVRLIDLVAVEAEQMDHHPDVALSWVTTTWTLSTHSAGGITQFDIELAHRIDECSHEIDGRQPQ